MNKTIFKRNLDLNRLPCKRQSCDVSCYRVYSPPEKDIKKSKDSVGMEKKPRFDTNNKFIVDLNGNNYMIFFCRYDKNYFITIGSLIIIHLHVHLISIL